MTQAPNTVKRINGMLYVSDSDGRAWPVSVQSRTQMRNDAIACMESRQSRKSCGCLCCQLYQLDKTLGYKK